MHVENDGVSLWFATSDAPAPQGEIAAGADVTVTVGVKPARPANRVEVRYSVNLETEQSVIATWLWNDHARDAQYFRAHLPAFRAGDMVDYTAVCRCAGRQIPSPEEEARFGSNFQVIGNDPESLRQPTAELGAESAPGGTTMLRRHPSTSGEEGGLPGPNHAIARRQDDDEWNGDWNGNGNDLDNVSLNITSPPEGHRYVGGNEGVQLYVLGTASAVYPAELLGVSVRFGDAGDFEPASGTARWAFTKRLTASFDRLKITARARYSAPGSSGSRFAYRNVSVIVDTTPPTLSEINIPAEAKGPGPTYSPESPITGRAVDSESGVKSVEIRINNGSWVQARNVSGNWRQWDYALTLEGHGDHPVVVRATDKVGNSRTSPHTITAIDTGPPTLTIFQPVLDETTITEGEEAFVAGTATDTGTGVKSVQWRFLTDPTSNYQNVSGDWSEWSVSIPGLVAGTYDVEIRAIDYAGLPETETRKIVVAVPFELEAVDRLAYLQDLLSFTERRVVAGEGTGVTRDMLVETFHQPFERLAKSGSVDAEIEATRQVNQVRICIEVLRRFLSESAASAETEYRMAAYQSLLRNLGTSYEEIRLARAADTETRKALAERLGFEFGTSRPDRLDKLFLSPELIATAAAEDELEKLFGLVSTQAERDPLQPKSEPELLQWQLEHLRASWADQDHGDSTSEPIIDPDLVTELDLRHASSGNTAYDLWQARKEWADALHIQIREVRESLAVPLEGFDHIVATYLEDLDLQELASDRENGYAIEQKLDEHHLSLQVFLYLMHVRELAETGTVLSEEWEDVYAILVQVRKRTDKYPAWHREEHEKDLTLGPGHFRLSAGDGPSTPLALPRWRSDWRARQRWERTLEARIKQRISLEQSLASAVDATEEAILPLLRDTLVASIEIDDAEENLGNWLTRRLQIDVRNSGTEKTTRIRQAIATLQGILFAIRTGRFSTMTPLLGENPLAQWKRKSSVAWLPGEEYTEHKFDEEWRWIGTYEMWRASMFVFGYPENYLLPDLREPPPSKTGTEAFWHLVDGLRASAKLTPSGARAFADTYLEELRAEPGVVLPPALQASAAEPFELTEQRSEADLHEHREYVQNLFENAGYGEGSDPHDAPTYLQEIFYFVPLQIALRLQKSGEYLASLDWFQTVYAYNLQADKRKIYYGLVLEEGLITEFQRPVDWVLRGLNPHHIAAQSSKRASAYTRFTLMSLVRCFLEFADAEFTHATNESIPRARTLYLAALDVLDRPEMQPPPVEGDAVPFPPNPVPQSLRNHAELNLLKLRSGRNIAGMERQSGIDLDADSVSDLPVIGSGGQITLPASVTLRPTPYRYATLIERAKELIGIAQQIEAAYLAALEKRDDKAYALLQAGHDIQIAKATVKLQDLRVDQADVDITLAGLQKERAEIQRDTYRKWIDCGPNFFEKQMLKKQGEANKFRKYVNTTDMAITIAQAATTAGSGGILGTGIGGAWAAFAGVVVGAGLRASFANAVSDAEYAVQLNSFDASHERRKDEWQLQKSVAEKDIEISRHQIDAAKKQKGVVEQERNIANIQTEQAEAVADFLAAQFTNVELYEWMSGVLERVYSYFLQQATATAQLAQSQLAFERHATPPAFIQGDYWQPPSELETIAPSGDEAPDRRGLTGSARLLQDIYRLDQHAFETKKRAQQLTQTFSLSRMAPSEFQLFIETGTLPFAASMELFDQAFPGQYLRLIRRVRVSVLALIPPNRGIRATLTASGVSRVVTAGGVFQDSFQTVVVRRDPERIAFTSPNDATGLFELQPDEEMLLPFEAMGVDTNWELQLPKAANPFDFRTIADVMFTIEYTALYNDAYRQQVIRELNRTVRAERSYSIQRDFPDQWYHLHNPPIDDTSGKLKTEFHISEDEFPPHLEGFRLESLVLYFARPESADFELDVIDLLFEGQATDGGEVTPESFGEAKSVDGLISTRRANVNWSDHLSVTGMPFGKWTIVFAATEEFTNYFREEQIEDILFVLSYTAETPAWPD